MYTKKVECLLCASDKMDEPITPKNIKGCIRTLIGKRPENIGNNVYIVDNKEKIMILYIMANTPVLVWFVKNNEINRAMIKCHILPAEDPYEAMTFETFMYIIEKIL